MATVDIYVLRCPLTNDIRYAGKANSASKRLKSHLQDAYKKKTPSACWILSLIANGTTPVMEVVDKVGENEWEEAERSLIAKLRSEPGSRLLNLADGGMRPSKTADQQRASGPRATSVRTSSPKAKRMWEIKLALGQHLKNAEKNEHYYSLIAKMKAAAAKYPEILGKWACL